MTQRPKFRKREIAFALAMGALGAGAGGAILMSNHHHHEPAAAAITTNSASYRVGPFERIATFGSEDVEVTLSDGFSVRAEGPPDALSRLEVSVEGGQLTIRPKAGNPLGLGLSDDQPGVRVYVTLPRLTAISLGGSGSVEVDRTEGQNVVASVNGSGDLSIQQLRAEQAKLSVSGSGTLSVGGAVRDAGVSVTGSGDVDARALRSDTATVSVAGSGDAVMDVSRKARVSIVGSGDVLITGTAQCAITNTGSGDVRCEGEPVE